MISVPFFYVFRKDVGNSRGSTGRVDTLVCYSGMTRVIAFIGLQSVSDSGLPYKTFSIIFLLMCW